MKMRLIFYDSGKGKVILKPEDKTECSILEAMGAYDTAEFVADYGQYEYGYSAGKRDIKRLEINMTKKDD